LVQTKSYRIDDAAKELIKYYVSLGGIWLELDYLPIAKMKNYN
jgi:hypothetical protein